MSSSMNRRISPRASAAPRALLEHANGKGKLPGGYDVRCLVGAAIGNHEHLVRHGLAVCCQ
jgi:hypothetical protein